MRRIHWVLMVVMLCPGMLLSQDRITVEKSGSIKSAIDWSGFTAGADALSRTFWSVLEADLLRSGWFVRARPGGGQFLLQGSATAGGRGVKVQAYLYRAGENSAILGKSWSEADARKLAHHVADEIVKAATGKPGIASTRLVMVGNRSGHKELYLCDADGYGIRQLTQDRSVSVAPKWDEQGRRLLYTSYLKRFPDIFLIELASGQRRQMARFPGLNTGGVFSPDGRYVACILSKDGNPELYVMPVSGGQPTRLTRTPNAAEASPTWSPDGNEIAFVSDRAGRPQVYRVSRRGGKAERLTPGINENVSPDWGSNGVIAYSSREGGRYVIKVMSPSTHQVKVVETGDYADYEDPSWAPDGRHIAATRTVNYASQVYILDTLGDPPVALTTQRGDWFSPAWSPQ